MIDAHGRVYPEKVQIAHTNDGKVEAQMGDGEYLISSGPRYSLEAALLALASEAFEAWVEKCKEEKS